MPQPFTYVGQAGVMTGPDGLSYMRARYYDAEVGRFISEDPAGVVDGPNLYAYVGGNPVMLVDPSGLSADTDPEYFDPRSISEEGPTWDNFREYAVDVGPYLVGGVGAGLAVRSVRPASGFLHSAHHNFGTKKLPAWMKHVQIQVDRLGASGPIRIPYGKKFRYKYGDSHLRRGNEKLGDFR